METILMSRLSLTLSTRSCNCVFVQTIRLKVLFSIHINKHLFRVHLLGRKFTTEFASQFSLQRLLTINSLTTLLAIHRLGPRTIQRRQLSFLTDVIQQFHRCLWCQTLLHIINRHCLYEVIIVDLHHRSIRTSSETFHLKK